MLKDKLLILDLDETLIYSTTLKLPYKEDFVLGEYYVYKRPGLDVFLKFVNDNFKLAVWTSSTPDYAQSIVEKIFVTPDILQFLWGRERCISKTDLETREQYWVKDLKKVKKIGYNLDKVLVVDDSPEKLQRNYGNHIPVIPYMGDREDKELKKLNIYLDELKNLESVRSVEKRNWRNLVS